MYFTFNLYLEIQSSLYLLHPNIEHNLFPTQFPGSKHTEPSDSQLLDCRSKLHFVFVFMNPTQNLPKLYFEIDLIWRGPLGDKHM